MKTLILAALMISFTGCTDAGCSKLKALGNAAFITCYSGGKVIYTGESTGKVSSEKDSDGYYFKDAKDGTVPISTS